MAVRLESSCYGKDLVRILRVVRSPTDLSHHAIIEYSARCLLSGQSLDVSFTRADNSPVVPTDTVKNTLNLLAKRSAADVVLCPERFALVVANHFLARYQHIDGCEVHLEALRWSRIQLPQSDGGPHRHSFVRDGDEKRVVSLFASRDQSSSSSSSSAAAARVGWLRAGLKDLLVLKSSGSAFYDFWQDEFTTLRPVKDRIFSTAIECHYNIDLPARPLPELVADPQLLPRFCALHRSVRHHTLRTFALDASASVQATLYRMAGAILTEPANAAVRDVEYALPNKHYWNVDLGWADEDNMREDRAEVFTPVSAPSGLIKAKIGRATSKL